MEPQSASPSSTPDPSAYTADEIAAYKCDNERRVREAASRGDTFIDAMPIRVIIESTADCGLFCRMCPYPAPRERWRRAGNDLSMRPELFELLAPQIFPHALTVNLSVVGEPLASPYLKRAIDQARAWQSRIELITSAMGLTPGVVERIGPVTAAVIVSFDGATRETFSHVRAGSHLDTVVRNIVHFDRWRRALPEGSWIPQLHLHPTLMRENIEELPGIVRLAAELRVDRVSASLAVTYSPTMAASSLLRHWALTNVCLERARRVADALGVDLELPAPFTDVEDVELAAIEVMEPPLDAGLLEHIAVLRDAPVAHPNPAADAGVPFSGSAPAEPPDDGKSYTCKLLWNELYVMIDGRVAPCCIEGRPVVGNVLEQDLASIWNGPEMQEMRERLRDGNPLPCCRDCSHNAERGWGSYREDTMIMDTSETPLP